MGDGMHGQSDSVLDPYLTHELGDMSLYRTFFDAQYRADLLVGAAGYEELEHFFFAIREGYTTRGEDAPRRRGHAFDENGEHASRRPYRALVHVSHCLDEFSR